MYYPYIKMSVVVLGRNQYGQKLSSILSDTNTYKKLAKDPSLASERKIKSMLVSFKHKQFMMINSTDICTYSVDTPLQYIVFQRFIDLTHHLYQLSTSTMLHRTTYPNIYQKYFPLIRKNNTSF